MPVMNFNLEDGLPPVSFTLKSEDCERFAVFMADCQAIKTKAAQREAQRKLLTDSEIIDIRRKTTAKQQGAWADTKAFARALEAKFMEQNKGYISDGKTSIDAAIEAAQGIKVNT